METILTQKVFGVFGVFGVQSFELGEEVYQLCLTCLVCVQSLWVEACRDKIKGDINSKKKHLINRCSFFQ